MMASFDAVRLVIVSVEAHNSLCAMELGVALLDGGNAEVQEMFVILFERLDDSAFFATLATFYEAVLSGIKRYRCIMKDSRYLHIGDQVHVDTFHNALLTLKQAQ